MYREIYAVGLLFLSIGLVFFYANKILDTIAALAAVVFLYCQARILHSGKGIPSWRVSQMPLMLIASGLLEGAGLYTLISFHGNDQIPATSLIPPVIILLILLNSFLWRRYLRNARTWGLGPIDRKILHRITPKLYIIGYILPFLIFGIIFLNLNSSALFAQIGSFLAIMGGVLWKAVVITQACHMQNFSLNKFPQRGSGKFSAPHN